MREHFSDHAGRNSIARMAGATAKRWRLVRLLAMLCIPGWREFRLTMLNRIKPDPGASLALAELVTCILDCQAPDPAGHSGSAG